MTRKFLTLAVVFAVLIFAALYVWGPSAAPHTQQPLATLSSASVSEFQAAFDAASEGPRLLVLVSPT